VSRLQRRLEGCFKHESSKRLAHFYKAACIEKTISDWPTRRRRMRDRGGATIVEFLTPVPGRLTAVDHNLSRVYFKRLGAGDPRQRPAQP
jgi:hypothetical protein